MKVLRIFSKTKMASFYDCSAQSSSSETEYKSEHLEDLSYGNLQTIPDCIFLRANSLHSLQLDNNNITSLPSCIALFKKLIVIDISSNNMTFICDEICQLSKLRTFIAKNNNLTCSSLPKDFGQLKSLEVVNMSGNQIERFPSQLTELSKLRVLQLGGNQIPHLPNTIKNLAW